LSAEEGGGPAGAPRPRRYAIDRRPISIVLVSRLWRQLVLGALFVTFALVAGLDPPDGLSREGWSTLCIFFLCAILWATGLIPLAITSLLAMCLVPLLGVMRADEAYGYFGSRVVFFILGALMLSAAMMRTGLSKRLGTLVVRRFGRTPRGLVMAVFLLCAAGSTVMSEHAVAAMMLPIVIDISRALGLTPMRSQLGKALFFALAWGCIIGGSLTVLGGGRGPLAIGILEEFSGDQTTILFLEYSLYGLPLVVVMLVAGALLLRRFKPELSSTTEALAALEAKLHEMGKVSPREHAIGLVMVATVVAWATVGDVLGLDTIAIIAVALLFALRIVSWDEIQAEMSWGIILMYGGAIALSAAMAASGAALWVMELLVPSDPPSATVLLLSVAFVSLVLTEFMSNAAVVALLLPPVLSYAETQGIDLRATTMAVVLPTNFAFMFPISTPATAMAWSAGYYGSHEVARTGITLNLLGFACVALLIVFWWPLIGIL